MSIKVTKGFLDRTESEMAVLLVAGRELVVPMSLLPDGAKEGEWFSVRIEFDPETTATMRGQVANLMKELSDE